MDRNNIKFLLGSLEKALISAYEKFEDAAVLTTKKRDALKNSDFAVPRLRALPIHDCVHTRAAMSRMGQVKGMTPAERKTAVNKIVSAGKKCGMDMNDFMKKHTV